MSKDEWMTDCRKAFIEIVNELPEVDVTIWTDGQDDRGSSFKQ